MKINDLLKNITNSTQKAIYAKRIRNCSPKLQKKIVEFYTKGTYTPFQYGINTMTNLGVRSINTTELQELYGMKPLEALFFIDALEKADSLEDKTNLISLLQSLVAGKHRGGPVVTQEMLDKVKENQPEVWAHYQALCKKAKEQEESAIEGLENNLTTEI